MKTLEAKVFQFSDKAQDIYESKEYRHALAVVESAVAVGTLNTPYASKALSTYLRLLRKAGDYTQKATCLMGNH